MFSVLKAQSSTQRRLVYASVGTTLVTPITEPGSRRAPASKEILRFLMDRSKNNLITRTLEVWQPQAARSISGEDAREIAENITGFFSLLLEWEAAEQEGTTCQTEDPCYAISA